MVSLGQNQSYATKMPGNEILVEAAFQWRFESDSKFLFSFISVVSSVSFLLYPVTPIIKCGYSGAVDKLDWVSLCFLTAVELCKKGVTHQQE